MYKVSVKEQIQELFSLLSRYPDHPKFLTIYSHYLDTLLNADYSYDDVVLPVMEMMTLLKHERPVIHSLLLKTQDRTIAMLAHIVTDIVVSQNRLNRIADIKTPC